MPAPEQEAILIQMRKDVKDIMEEKFSKVDARQDAPLPTTLPTSKQNAALFVQNLLATISSLHTGTSTGKIKTPTQLQDLFTKFVQATIALSQRKDKSRTKSFFRSVFIPHDEGARQQPAIINQLYPKLIELALEDGRSYKS